MRSIRRNGHLLFLTICLSLVYTVTLAPDITWANRGDDGGDLIVAAATKGIPHPSGYPTYILLAQLIQSLPIGTLAFRTNLLSTLCAVLSALVVADIVRRFYGGNIRIGIIAGTIAGVSLGLAPLFWSQAVITEVYTLNALFVALILHILLNGIAHKLTHTWADRLSGLLFGVALGTQATVAFLLPPFLLSGISKKEKEQGSMGAKSSRAALFPSSLAAFFSSKRSVRKFIWILLGLQVYLIIPIRARSGSPVIWGDPVDWKGFWWLVSGQYYHWRVFSLPLSHLWARLQDWVGMLVDQFSIFGMLLVLWALLFYWKHTHFRKLHWITVWIILTYVIFAVGYNTHDAYVLLIPVIVILSIWMGLGSAALLEALVRWQNKATWILPAGVILLVFPVLINAWRFFPLVDASQDIRATTFGQAVMQTAPQNAIIYTLDDADSFTLWYYHFALGGRPDIAVLQKRLLPEIWYRERMREIYPELIIPEESGQTWYLTVMAANPKLQNCEITLDKPEVVACRSKGN